MRGFTLVEVLLASVVGALVITMAVALYMMTLRLHGSDVSSFKLESDVAEAVDLLRSDLRETYLGSVRLTEDGLSLVSANPLGEVSSFQVSRFGAPRWQKVVFYGTVPDPKVPSQSWLVRQERALVGQLPQAWSGDFPPLEPDKGRVLTRNLLSKGYRLNQNPQGFMQAEPSKSGKGGFQVGFVCRDNHLQLNSPEPAQSTQLVEVSLTLVETSDQDRLHSTAFNFRVYPRN